MTAKHALVLPKQGGTLLFSPIAIRLKFINISAQKHPVITKKFALQLSKKCHADI